MYGLNTMQVSWIGVGGLAKSQFVYSTRLAQEEVRHDDAIYVYARYGMQ